MVKKLLIALGVVIVVAVGVVFALREQGAGVVHPVTAPQPAPAVVKPPADCLLPGPPPVPPNGEMSTAAEMRLGHDVIQAFVEQLEKYQACRNDQADHAAAGVPQQQKDAWIHDGNAAVDEANALAGAFAMQLKAFKARSPGH